MGTPTAPTGPKKKKGGKNLPPFQSPPKERKLQEKPFTREPPCKLMSRQREYSQVKESDRLLQCIAPLKNLVALTKRKSGNGHRLNSRPWMEEGPGKVIVPFAQFTRRREVNHRKMAPSGG